MIESLRVISIASGVQSNCPQNKKFKNTALRFVDTSQTESIRLESHVADIVTNGPTTLPVVICDPGHNAG
jgi:hypothetical protein